MPPMPYHLEKGPIWSVLEDYANAGPERLIELLLTLRSGDPVATAGGLDSPNLDAPKYPTYQDRVDHVNRDWFGMYHDSTGTWVEQQDTDFDPLFHPETGFWQNYFGDVQELLRVTLIRTCEVALGLDHGADIARGQSTPRCWPISFFLRCPTPWFEGWVTWHASTTDPQGAGHVVTHIHTPPHGSPVMTSPLSPPNRSGPKFPEYVEEPTACDSQYGMWIVTYRHHVENMAIVPYEGDYIADQRPVYSAEEARQLQLEMEDRSSGQLTNTNTGTPVGLWLFPTLGPVWKGEGGIVTVQPCEADGGVLSAGRPY